MGKILTLGEIMLRFSTHQTTRLAQSDSLAVHYGGGEANVAISLANYGHEAYFASKVPDNSLGEAAKKHLHRYGVHTNHLLSGGERLGSYYVESGVGQRAASVIYDRAHSSFATMTANEWDLEALFKDVDLFHVSGITPALSEFWQTFTLDLVKAAKNYGCKISFDINYRSKLWTQAEASKVVQQLMPFVDYCSAGKLDARYLFGVEKPAEDWDDLPHYYRQMKNQYPNIEMFYSTKREVVSASVNFLTGTLWQNQQYFESQQYTIDAIVDRVGGGDAFCGGILHGVLTNKGPQEMIEFATAASTLKHTVSGDCNQFSEQEVNSFLAAGSGKIIR